MEEAAENEWPMNKEVERMIKECSSASGIDVRSLDEFILDDLCFSISEETMALSNLCVLPCSHAQDTLRLFNICNINVGCCP